MGYDDNPHVRVEAFLDGSTNFMLAIIGLAAIAAIVVMCRERSKSKEKRQDRNQQTVERFMERHNDLLEQLLDAQQAAFNAFKTERRCRSVNEREKINRHGEEIDHLAREIEELKELMNPKAAGTERDGDTPGKTLQ